LAPRRPGDNSRAVPTCTRAPVTLAPGQTVRERWARAAYEPLDVASTRVTVAVGDLRIETPTSALMAADPDFPAPAPSTGEQFDAFMANARLRAAIAAQPARSWIDADVREGHFQAVSRRYERAFTATVADGRMTVRLPRPSDAARPFPSRPPTLPPGVRRAAGDYRPRRDVEIGSVVLPNGRVVTDDVPGGGPLRSRYITTPGTYPVRATLARPRGKGKRFDRVALATLVVSARRPVRWRPDRGVVTDGGTASFTSPQAETALKKIGPDRGEQWMDDAFTAMAAHDYVGADRNLPGGTDMVLFSTGFGDGMYPLFVGLDADGRPARYVLDFRVLRLRWR
jgi:hypothetical protein